MALSGFGLLAQTSSANSNPVVSRFAMLGNYSRAENANARRPLLREPPRAPENPRAPDQRAWVGPRLRGDAPELRLRIRRHEASPVHARAVPLDLDARRHHRPHLSDRGAGPRRLERRALVSIWKERRLAGGRHRRVRRRRRGELERRASTSRHRIRPCPSSACSRSRR